MVTPPQIPGLTDWRPLARGGFATVWQARQVSLNRLVAVKVDQRTLEVETEQRRFLREAGAAGRMSGHPGIVTVHDAGILTDDRPYLVMELCPGGSLTRWLKADARPSQHRVREVGVRIADALAAAHSRGVLHRDVKPANILIDAYNNPGLADFGLAALPDPGMELSQTLEALTPAYAPPEAFEQQPPTEFGDVYSLAATLYALLGGQPPRWAEGAKPTVGAALEQLKTPIEPIPGVDPEFMNLLLIGLADQPTARPSALEFRDQLAALSLPDGAVAEDDDGAGGAGSAEQLPAGGAPVDPSRPGSHRLRSLVAAAIAAALLAVAVVITASLLTPNSRVADPTPGGTVPAGGAPGPTSSSTSPASTVGPTQPGTSTSFGLPSTSVVVPDGFSDCSEELGANTYCAAIPECWGSLISIMDSPINATPADCDKLHLYQTYAAGQLPEQPRLQSQVDENAEVRRVCTAELANRMLPKEQQRNDWEIWNLPPQGDDSRDALLYRCVVGRGERYAPLPLRKR